MSSRKLSKQTQKQGKRLTILWPWTCCITENAWFSCLHLLRISFTDLSHHIYLYDAGTTTEGFVHSSKNSAYRTISQAQIKCVHMCVLSYFMYAKYIYKKIEPSISCMLNTFILFSHTYLSQNTFVWEVKQNKICDYPICSLQKKIIKIKNL